MVAALAHDVVGPDDAVLHREERRQVREREPEEGEEHLRRQRNRELGREVALAAIDERVDPLVDERGDRSFELGHVPGREERVEDLAVLHVVGGVDLQRDERPDRAHRQDRVGRGRREHLGEAEAFMRRFLGGEDVAHPRYRHHRRGRAQRPVHLLRVPARLRVGVEDVEVVTGSGSASSVVYDIATPDRRRTRAMPARGGHP